MKAAEVLRNDGDAPDAHSTGPIRLRAVLTSLSLTPGPTHLPLPAATPIPPWLFRAQPEVRWFTPDRASVELISDDPITVARTAGTFTPHPTALPLARWVITALRAASLDAVPHAFVGTPVVQVHGFPARFHSDETLGDTWWMSSPPLIVHHNRGSRWVGIRYTDPAAARNWTPRILGWLLATPIGPWRGAGR